jgi:hypothetical protein
MTKKRLFLLYAIVLAIIGFWLIAYYTCWQVAIGVFITHYSIAAEKESKDA